MGDLASEEGFAVWHSHVASGVNALRQQHGVVVVALLLPGLFLLVGCFAAAKGKRRTRRMSFSSSFMLPPGSFPTRATMVQPVINACLFFDDLPDVAALLAAAERLGRFENFRSAPAASGSWFGGVAWAEVGVPAEALVSSVSVLDAAAVDAEIERVRALDIGCEVQTDAAGSGSASASASKLPLWRLHRVLDSSGGGGAVIFRVHHTIGDGMSLVAVAQTALRALDADAAATDRAAAAAAAAARSSRRGGGGAGKLLSLPFKLMRAVFEVATLAMTPFDSATPFRRPNRNGEVFSGKRQTVVLPDLPLPLVKSIKDAAGATVNDVMLSLTAGAIRRYGEWAAGSSGSEGPLRVRALLPVALPRKDVGALRNMWAFISAPCCMDEADPVSRIGRIHEALDRLKTSPVPLVQYAVQDRLLPLVPGFVPRQVLSDTMSRHTMVFTNVPGPPGPVEFAGSRVTGIRLVFVNLIPQVSVLSYSGKVSLNWVVDPDEVKGCSALAFFFWQEMTEVCTALQLPPPPKAALSLPSRPTST